SAIPLLPCASRRSGPLQFFREVGVGLPRGDRSFGRSEQRPRSSIVRRLPKAVEMARYAFSDEMVNASCQPALSCTRLARSCTWAIHDSALMSTKARTDLAFSA